MVYRVTNFAASISLYIQEQKEHKTQTDRKRQSDHDFLLGNTAAMAAVSQCKQFARVHEVPV